MNDDQLITLLESINTNLKNSFYEQIIATFIGAVLAFVIGYSLYWLQKHVESKILRKNIVNELNYDLEFLTEYLKDFNKLISDLQTELYPKFQAKHSQLKRYFLDKGYFEGKFYELIDPETMFELYAMLGKYTLNSDQYWHNIIFNPNIQKADSEMKLDIKEFQLNLCKSERDKIDADLKILKRIIKDLKKNT